MKSQSTQPTLFELSCSLLLPIYLFLDKLDVYTTCNPYNSKWNKTSRILRPLTSDSNRMCLKYYPNYLKWRKTSDFFGSITWNWMQLQLENRKKQDPLSHLLEHRPMYLDNIPNPIKGLQTNLDYCTLYKHLNPISSSQSIIAFTSIMTLKCGVHILPSIILWHCYLLLTEDMRRHIAIPWCI